MNTYAYLVKSKAKATEAKNLFCWFSSKSDSRAEREILNILEDNGIDVGRGANHQLPIRTDWFVVDDLPEEGTLDDTWCDRYQLTESGISWMSIPPQEPVECIEEHTETSQITGGASSTPLDDGLEYPVAQLTFRKKLLSQFICAEQTHHVNVSQRIQIAEMEMDTDNSYVQNLLLAAENIPELKKYSTQHLWKLTDAVKSVFPADLRQELGVLMKFMNAWVDTHHIDRGLLIKEWSKGNRVSHIQRTDTGTNAGGGNMTDRNGPHNKLTLEFEVALGKLARSMDFDIYDIPMSIEQRAKSMTLDFKDAEYLAWRDMFMNTPGILDYSRASNVALIKTAPENLYLTPVAHREYISRNMTESNHATPDPHVVDVACGRTSFPLSANQSNSVIEAPTGSSEEINSLTSQPGIRSLGAGIFTIDGLLATENSFEPAKNTAPVEVKIEEVVTSHHVQMEENNDNEAKAGNEVLMDETADVSAQNDAGAGQSPDPLNNDSAHQIEESTSEQLYTHLMVDLETMGDNPDAPIVSIGAIFFAPDTGHTGAEFYKVISLESAMAFGGIPDAGTILWWMRKSSEARSALLVEDSIPLDDALLQFNDFIGVNAANGSDSVQLWGNGATFDNVILSQSYKRAEIPRPWTFRNDRDVRTVEELGKAVGINPRYEIQFVGDLHNALDDARHQVRYVSAIWQHLIQN